MTIEEIVQGESKNIEFKITLPEKSEKYTKTIIAFANTQGGRQDRYRHFCHTGTQQTILSESQGKRKWNIYSCCRHNKACSFGED